MKVWDLSYSLYIETSSTREICKLWQCLLQIILLRNLRPSLCPYDLDVLDDSVCPSHSHVDLDALLHVSTLNRPAVSVLNSQ